MDWNKEKDLVLQWWPVYLTDKPQGHVFVEGLEQALWGAKTKDDYEAGIDQIRKIWGDDPEQFLEDILTPQTHYRFNRNTDLFRHFGASMGDFLYRKITHQTSGALHWVKNQTPQVMTNEIVHLAQRLKNQFGLASVNCTKTCDPSWLKKQILDATMGFANLSTLLNIPEHRIGQGELHVWFRQSSSHRHSMFLDNHLDIHIGGGGVSQTWAHWALLRHSAGNEFFQKTRLWQHTWPKGARGAFSRQEHFLHMSRRRFKSLMENADVTTDLGQKTLRRYKAFCKWADDVEKGQTLLQTTQAWNKVKTGNRIAWSTENKDLPLNKAWLRAEKGVERAFWDQPMWHMPAWVQPILNPNEEDCAFLWSLAFEAYVRHEQGYDSWLATDKSHHPIMDEAKDVFSFLTQQVAPMLITHPK